MLTIPKLLPWVGIVMGQAEPEALRISGEVHPAKKAMMELITSLSIQFANATRVGVHRMIRDTRSFAAPISYFVGTLPIPGNVKFTWALVIHRRILHLPRLRTHSSYLRCSTSSVVVCAAIRISDPSGVIGVG